MKKNLQIHYTVILLLVYIQSGLSQNYDDRKFLIMSENNISASIVNTGLIGTGQNSLLWNNLGYSYFFTPMITGEVINSSGDTLHITSDSYGRDRDPNDGTEWMFLPEFGFSNPNSSEPANSTNKESWPVRWTEWDGEYGLGEIIAENETYYVINDFKNSEFDYFPSINDTSMRGLGVRIGVRIYQFAGGLKDVLILKYFITNKGTKPLEKLYFGFHGDPMIGGIGDYNDDILRISNISAESPTVKKQYADNTIYMYDSDGIGQGGLEIGYWGMKFLETPEDLSLTALNVSGSGSAFQPQNDDKMWEFFNNGIDTTSNYYNSPADILFNFGTGPFSLSVNETKIVKLALFFSENYNDLITDATYVALQHNWVFMGNEPNMSGGNEAYTIKLDDFSNKVSENVDVTWNYSGNSTDARIFLEYSNNKGEDWYPLSTSMQPSENFTWNTSQLEDGVNYILRIIAYNQNTPEEYFYNISNTFTVDDPNKNAKPEIELLNDFSSKIVSNSPLLLEWKSNDADDNQLDIKLEYSFYENGPFNLIASQSYENGINNFSWDLTELPNSETYYLRITASDGKIEGSILSEPFEVNIFEKKFKLSNIKPYQGNATPIIEIQTIDQSSLSNNEYSIQFNVIDDFKTFDLKNITNNEILLSNYEVNQFTSTPLIEGMKITVVDVNNGINYDLSRFSTNSARELKYQIKFPPDLGSNKIKVDEDFLFIFNDPDTSINGEWLFPDTMETLLGEIVAPFSIWSIEGNAPNFSFVVPANFVVYEKNPETQSNGRWDIGEEIIFLPLFSVDATTSYQIVFDFSDEVLPRNGDSLYLITYNEIEDKDEFRFQPDSDFILNIQTNSLQQKYALSNNYPNPFNPSTIINYSIPKQSNVTLKVFDILGREVNTLVNQVQPQGNYKVELDGTSLSSGIYFYRLQAGEFVETKKMIILK